VIAIKITYPRLMEVPAADEPEHKAVCSIDGEPWPCKHAIERIHYAHIQRSGVRCLACGKPRVAWTSLDIAESFDGRPVYFHDRKGCREAALAWWDENVRPLTGHGFRVGGRIEGLLRYVGRRAPKQALDGGRS
jgi:hypothetical protein